MAFLTVALLLFCLLLPFDSAQAWMVAPPDPRDAIVIVPGITTSQNKKMLYYDKVGGKWKFAFGFNVYKSLIRKLEEAGYEEGADLFIAHYDWRNSASHNAEKYLKPKISQAKAQSESGMVDVVAHSFGGVVSRAYIQSDMYDGEIDQLVTLGTPHRGSADAYVAWEGGIYPSGWEFWMTGRIERIEKALKKTREKPDIERPLSFREFFPSLRDMMPVDDFVKKNGELEPIANLKGEKNEWLKSLNDNIDVLNGRVAGFATIAGSSKQTLKAVNVSDGRSEDDIRLLRWRDGSANPVPPPLDSSEGDSRVLLSSANISEENIVIENALHHKLPEEAQDKVFEVLGLEPVDEWYRIDNEPRSGIGIVMLSPVSASISGPGGAVLSPTRNDFGADKAEYDGPADAEDPAEITILDPVPGTYTITYTGTGNGEYTVIKTYADDDQTESIDFSGIAAPGRLFTSTFTITDEEGDNFEATVPEIATEEPAKEPSVSSDPPGEETDCCPGPDPILSKVEAAAKGKVLGAKTVTSKYRHLVPIINKLHRQAYGRNPSYEEHIYWWDRVLKGHFQKADQLLGAMEWRFQSGLSGIRG